MKEELEGSILCTVLSGNSCAFFVTAQISTSILPYLKLWPVDTYVDLMMQVMYYLEKNFPW